MILRFPQLDWTMGSLQGCWSPWRYDLSFRLVEMIDSTVLANKLATYVENYQDEDGQNKDCNVQ